MRNFKVEDTILYEDKDVLVCYKPAGLAVQNARFGTMDLESALKNYLAAKAPGMPPYLAVVHRLDQPVEGVLVFAKTSKAAKDLSRQMAGGEMEKQYLAVTSRIPLEILQKYGPGETGEAPVFWRMEEQKLTDYLKKDGKTNTSAVVPKGTPGSKEARLTYRVLEEISDASVGKGKRYLLEIRLDTGRHHQIRVQLSHAGMPLLGDKKYGLCEKTTGALGLCSCRLTFVHPVKKKQMKFEVFPNGEAFRGFEPKG